MKNKAPIGGKKSFSTLPSSSRKFISKSSFVKKVIPGMLGNKYKGGNPVLKRRVVGETFDEKMGMLDPRRGGQKSARLKYLSKKEFVDMVTTGLGNIEKKGIRSTRGKIFKEKKPGEIFQREALSEFNENLPPLTEKGLTKEQERLEHARRRWQARGEGSPDISKLSPDQRTARQKIEARIGEIQHMARESQNATPNTLKWQAKPGASQQISARNGTGQQGSFHPEHLVAPVDPSRQEPPPSRPIQSEEGGTPDTQEPTLSEPIPQKPVVSVNETPPTTPASPQPASEPPSEGKPQAPKESAKPESSPEGKDIESNLPL